MDIYTYEPRWRHSLNYRKPSIHSLNSHYEPMKAYNHPSEYLTPHKKTSKAWNFGPIPNGPTRLTTSRDGPNEKKKEEKKKYPQAAAKGLLSSIIGALHFAFSRV